VSEEAYWRIAVAVPAAAAAAIEHALEPFADSVSTFDTEPGATRLSSADQPDSWQTDLWIAEHCLVEAVTTVEPDRAAVVGAVALAAASVGLAPPPVDIAPLADRDWVAETYGRFPPIRVGRFEVRGSHVAEPPVPGRITVVLDAQTAFGTGEHETTRGCLAALDAEARRPSPRRIADIGSGSGILAIAAAKLWHRPVIATDIDPEAARIARINAGRNGVGGLIRSIAADGYRDRLIATSGPFDLVLANILARPLARLAPSLARHLSVGGTAILSGLLVGQESFVLAAHRRQGMRLVRRHRHGDWSTLVLAR